MKAIVAYYVTVELDEENQFLVNNPEKLRETIVEVAEELKANNMIEGPFIIDADFDMTLDRGKEME